MTTKRKNNGAALYTTVGDIGGLSFDFQELPPSLNKTLRAHWTQRRNVKQYFAYLFRSGYNSVGVAVAEPVEIVVTWRVMRLMDHDNAKARFKLIGDAMKDAGIISDDNPEVVKALHVKQERVKHRAEQGFVVEVREYLPFAEPTVSDPLGVREAA